MTASVRKVQFGFDPAALETLEKLQKASGATTMAEVVRAALGLYDWAHDQVKSGYAVGAFKHGQPLKEVVVFRNVMQADSKRDRKSR